jgi:hypothetical protein
MTYRFIPCRDPKEAQELLQILLDHSVPAEPMGTVIRLRPLTKVPLALVREQTKEMGLRICHHYCPINKQDQQEHVDKIKLMIESTAQHQNSIRQPGYDHIKLLVKHLPIKLRGPLKRKLAEAMAAPEPPPWYRKEDGTDNREQERSKATGRMEGAK